MGIDMQTQQLVVIKNTFLQVIEADSQSPQARGRAVSEYTGTCLVRDEERRKNCDLILEADTETPPSSCVGRVSDESQRPSLDSQRAAVLQEQAPLAAAEDNEHTTLMLRNVPNSHDADWLVGMLNMLGFQGRYDFVYLPIDFRTSVNLGYAFVNLVSHVDAMQLFACLQGFSNWTCESHKVCEVTWAHPHQGLVEHLERYRNSPVMHENVPDSFRPRLFMGGYRVAFPPPTKRLRPPRVRPARRQQM